MYKLFFCLRRRSDLTREQFLEHWHGIHADIARRGASVLGAVRYIQNHTAALPINDALRASRGAPECFDGVVELWFNSVEDVSATFDEPEARAAIKALIVDEPNFIDLEASPIFLTESHSMWGADGQEGSLHSGVTLVSGDNGAIDSAFAAPLE
ncbi:EthD domain-containing protein [Microbacterium alcoholitolerans]|uniref:EthD domain-containing protein n=1 Tax=unclassified Microbacterium TaxID=2609290 RepID=UPI003D1876E5